MPTTPCETSADRSQLLGATYVVLDDRSVDVSTGPSSSPLQSEDADETLKSPMNEETSKLKTEESSENVADGNNVLSVSNMQQSHSENKIETFYHIFFAKLHSLTFFP